MANLEITTTASSATASLVPTTITKVATATKAATASQAAAITVATS